MTDVSLLESVASGFNDGYELMGSKWQNCECEVIATQTITACNNNQKNHGDAFSWLMGSATRGRQMCGTNNRQALQRLQDDGSIVVESYRGPLSPPDGVATESGSPLVIRVTDSLLRYVAKFIRSDE